ncbi:FHIPEP family type III secretion protein [Streptomyces sp. NPDC048441]|uniref:FHIPEP family type III secretion protein n=1 Tax=Streptomyces sp. NPDC048441 TaxID=3365552 RepID=UPI003710EBB1
MKTEPDAFVELRLEAAPELESIGSPEALETLASRAGGILAKLGLPDRVRLEYASAPAQAPEPLRISMDGVRCRLPRRLVDEAAAYVGDNVAPTAGDELTEAVAIAVERALVVHAARSPADTAATDRGDVHSIDIRVEREYFGLLTSPWPSDATGHLASLREQLFKETGSLFPPFVFSAADDLPPRGIVVVVDGLPDMPFRGIPAGSRFVDRTSAELLENGVPGKSAYLPAAGFEGALVEVAHVEELGDDVRVWDPWGYLLMLLAVQLEPYAESMLMPEDVSARLDRLAGAYPETVHRVRDRFPLPELTGILQGLLAARVPVLDLRRICELLLMSDPADQVWIHPDQEAEALHWYVRRGLGNQTVSALFGEPSDNGRWYVVDLAVEARLAEADEDEQLDDEVVAAVRARLTDIPAYEILPVVVVRTAGAWQPLRDLLVLEFPLLIVLDVRDVLEAGGEMMGEIGVGA